MKRRLPALIAVLIVVALVVAGVIVSNQQTRSALIHTYTGSPTAFSFQYPDGWQVSIPIQNILLLADPAAQRGEPGATFTVQRSTALADEGSLGAALNTYLRQGALRPDRAWQQIGEVVTTALDGREALQLDLEGGDSPSDPQFHSRVVAAQAANGLIYVFALNAPLAQWSTSAPLLEAVLASARILE